MVEEIPKQAIKLKITKPETPPDSTPQYIYHWDRIVGALSVLFVLVGLLGYGLYAWLIPSFPPASVEVDEPQAHEEIRVETAQEADGGPPQGPMTSPSQPAPVGVTAAQIAETELPAPRIGDASVTTSDSPRSPMQPEALSEKPPQTAEEKALKAGAPRPAGAESLPPETAEEKYLPPPEEAEMDEPEQRQLPVREESAEPATVQSPALEPGEEEQRVTGQALTSEDRSESPASEDPSPSVAVGIEPVSDSESGTTATVTDSLEGEREESGNGRFQPGSTSIDSPAVKRFMLAPSVAGNEPKGSLEDVTVGAKSFAEVSSFSEVVGLEGEVLQYRWLHEGKEVLRIRVPIGAKRWRSHTTKRIYARMKGSWRVELRDSAGTLLASTGFVF